MVRSRILILAAALLSVPVLDAVAPTDAQAQNAGRWELLGQQTVTGKDVDTFKVGEKKGDYTAIKIEVERAPCVITEVKVFFKNGQTQTPNIGKLVFNTGNSTREIDLTGGARDIEKIVLKYEDIKDNKVPLVKVWGKDVSPLPTLAPNPSNSVKFGEHDVDGKNDEDTFDVDGKGGPIDGIWIKAEADNVKIQNVRIQFMGESNFQNAGDDFTMVRGQWKFVNIPGKKPVKFIKLKYSNIGKTERARIEVWGRK